MFQEILDAKSKYAVGQVFDSTPIPIGRIEVMNTNVAAPSPSILQYHITYKKQ